MTHEIYLTLILATYKLATLATGLAFAYMGYRLFLAGVSQPAGGLEGKIERVQLNITNAAPGTFFAVFGALLVGVAVFRGVNVNVTEAQPAATESRVENFLPSEPPF